MSHVLTPNNSSIKSRGPVGEEQADVSEQLLNLTVDVTEISEAVHRQSRKLAELVCELINYYWLFCCCWCLFTWVYFLCVFLKLIKTQLSQAHIMRVWNVIYFLTRESVSHYKRPLRSCKRNKILRSANAKYHYILPFFYQINKGDLVLKYLSVFCCEFMDLVNFLAVLCDPWHSIRKTKSIRLHRNTTGSPYLVYLKMVCGLKTHWITDFFDQRQSSLSSLHQKSWLDRWIHTKRKRNTSKVSLLYIFYRKKVKYNDI